MNSSQNNRQILKRVNSATNIISKLKDNNDEVTDDDELVQKSSIISYQEDQTRQNIAGKLRLQEEDIAHMDMATLQSHLSTLREAIGQLYLGIKQKTKDENDIQSPEEEREERDIIMSLDSYVIIEYIKSSVDIILNLKFEEIEKKLMDRNHSQDIRERASLSQDLDNSIANPSQNKHQKHSISSSQQDSTNGGPLTDGPPQVYEEIIQKLEAEVRKHFRIEQQLKLHIDSLENRIEELENENEKLDEENNRVKDLNSLKNDTRFKEMEELLKAKDDVIKMHEMQYKQVKETESKLKKDLEVTKGQMAEMIQKQKQSSIECDNGQIILNKTQPMILKQAVKDGGRKMSLKQQNQESMLQPQFGSYSSNNSFAMMVDGISPDKGRSTPDISGHPYLHQTQIVQKRKSIGPGTGSKSKKFVPNSVVESLGLQHQFNAVNSTYSTASSGKIIGQRRLSSQHGRNNHTTTGAKTAVFKATQNSWLGNPNSIQVPVASLFSQSQQSQQHITGQPQFSNIINNNIQGLSINYQNQIIQPVDPIQQFANNFLGVQNTHINDEDSESSTMNSHRRCKSQNLKRGSIERKRKMQQQIDQSDMLLINQIADSAIDSQKIRANQTGAMSHLEDTHSFEGLLSKHQQTQNQSFMMNESTNQLVNDFSNESNNRKNFIMQGQSITSSKMRSGSNRGMLQQQNQAIDEFARNRFNQSYGSSNGNGKQKKVRNNLLNTSATNQSIEKTSNVGHSTGGPRTRNKKQNLTHNITMQNANQYQVLTKQFEGNMIDLNTFKTTTSTSNNNIPQHNTTQVIGGGQTNFSVPKQNNSATNTAAALLNQNNIHMLKQQILAHKKASNLLMKGGISPHKKMN